MTLKNQEHPPDVSLEAPVVPQTRREFVEPEISEPVDVLEATTFFQAVDSGATN